MTLVGGSPAEPEALKHSFSYLVNSIDTAVILPVALSRSLITDRQRTECSNENDSVYKRAEKFLGYLQRAVNGDYYKFHTFVQILQENGQAEIASRLRDELAHSFRSMQQRPFTSSSTDQEPEHVVVPDVLVEELADLRFGFANLIFSYEEELQKSLEAQEKFVKFLPRLFRKAIDNNSFQSHFNTFVENEVSLFNTHYLKQLCTIFPKDVRSTTRQFVDDYEQQRQHFMTSATVSQFKQLFPATATASRLSSSGKVSFVLKLDNKWGSETLDDLNNLVIKFGISGSHLHLSKVEDGCIAVTWLCSITEVKQLKMAILEATGLLQTMKVLQVFIGQELVVEETITHKPVTVLLVHETDIDYQCPICFEPLTQPFLTDCGHHLCQSCLCKSRELSKNECPTCREPNMLNNARYDKYLQRKVCSLQVRCSEYKEGCKWVGKLTDLHDHLDPAKGQCGIACPFNCGRYIRKSEVKEHTRYCDKRMISCENCGYYNTFNLVTEKHYPICPLSPSAITPTTVSPQYLYNQSPMEFIIDNYHEKKHANRVWYSSPFYTHNKGYKFRFIVYPNGVGTSRGSHVSIFAQLKKGKYDAELEWPFEGDIRVELLNWTADKSHHLCTIHFNRYHDPDGKHTSRVTILETGTCYGYHQFISHTDLMSSTNTEYVCNDYLKLRVSAIVYSTPLLHLTPAWQVSSISTQSEAQFTISEYSKRRQFNNKFFSPPFTTSSQGYKFCLVVCANGYGSGEGSHLSIGICIMKGQHDGRLRWPFTGTIIFELLNWLEDKGHYKNTIPIENDFIRITKGEYGKNYGRAQFILQSSLSSQYLYQDCICVRVQVIINK